MIVIICSEVFYTQRGKRINMENEKDLIPVVSLLYTLDDGKFNGLMQGMKPKNECFKCTYFNHTLPNIEENQYGCRAAPGCMASTLNNSLISYLLFKTGVISYEEHIDYIGM